MKLAIIILLLLLPITSVPIYMYHSRLTATLQRYVDYGTRAQLEQMQLGCSTLFIFGLLVWAALLTCAAFL